MKMLFGVLLLSSLVCLTSAPAQAGLVGQSVTVDYLFFGVVAQQVAFLTVPPGGATFRVPPGNELQALTLFDNQITLSTDPGATVTYSANSLNFNGYEIVLPQNPPRSLEITAVDINPATTQAGFDSSRVTFGIDSVLLNMQGLTSLPGLNVALDLQFIEIPPQ